MRRAWELLERAGTSRTVGTARTYGVHLGTIWNVPGRAGLSGQPGVHHLQISAGWERFRFNGVVELWRCWVMALGRLRFGLQRRLRGRTSSGPAHRNAERAQARVGQDVVW